MKYSFLIILQLFALLPLTGQLIITPITSPETLVACGESGEYLINVTNAENNGFGNILFQIDLPVGMEYVAGSISNNVTELDISDVNNPQFTIPGLPALFRAEIRFRVLINCQFTNNEVVQYTLAANNNTYTAQEQPLANYFFPEVVITTVDNPVINLAVNGRGQRTFTIIQSTPGASLDSLFFVNNYDADMASLGANLGTLAGSGLRSDTILLTGMDLPGLDGTFDFGDTLRLTEIVQLLGCSQANSVVELFWRCGEETCQSFVTNTLITVGTGSPDLRIESTSGFSNQVSANNPNIVRGGFCDTVTLTYRLENFGEENALGAGAVYDLVIGLGLNNNLFSSPEPFDIGIFPNWSLLAFINDSLIDLGTYAFPTPDPMLGYNLNFSQLTQDIDGVGGLADVDGDGFFDDLPVGAFIDLTVQIVYDPYATDGCAYLSGYPYNGGAETNFRLGYYFEDQCDDVRDYWYSVNDPGINVVSLFTHRSVTYNVGLEDSNLFPGQITQLDIRPDGAWASPCGSTDSIILEIVLPDGLAATSNAYGPGQFHGIVRQSGDTVWLASTERGTFTQPWGLDVMLDCGEAIVDTTVDLSFLYFCAPDCGPMRRIDCAEIPIDFLAQCEDCANGVDTRAFETERVNLGWTNSTHTQRVDPATDPTINLKAAIDFDSVSFRLNGILRGAGPFDSLYARIKYQGMNPAFADPTRAHFQLLGSTFEYYTADGNRYTCYDAPVSISFNATEIEHQILANLEPFFGVGGCLEQVNRQAGDSIALRLYALVTDNTPRRALPVPELTGELFLRQQGVEINCSEYLDDFVLEQVIPNSNLAYASQEHYGCAEIYFNNNSIANPGHIYDGDQFPNEVRTIVDVSEVRILLEGNWQVTPGSSDLLANGSFDENDAVSTTAPFVTVPIPDPNITFDGFFTIFSYVNPGDWPNGDLVIGGSNPAHNIRFRATPGCQVPTDRPFRMIMETDMTRYLNAPEALRDTITAVREIAVKTYQSPTVALGLSSPQAFIPDTDTVSWDLRVTNTTSYGNPDKLVRNGWLAIEAPANVQIFSMQDISDPDNIVESPILNYADGSNYWVAIGAVGGFSTRNFRVIGLYENCEEQVLLAKFGYSCFDYPNPDPGAGYLLADSSFQCPVAELPLFIQPSPVSLVLDIESTPPPSPLCMELDYAVTISNLQLATAYSNGLAINLPLGASIVFGSSRIETPSGSGNWAPIQDPINLDANRYSWNIENDPNGLSSLLGVNDFPNNSYRVAFRINTACGLNAGLRLGFTATGVNSCGTVSERTAFSEKLLIEGLPTITNNYGLRLFTPDDGLQACDTARIQARLINLGPFPTSAVEFAQLALPASFDYVNNANNPTLDDNTTFAGQRFLRFPIPPGLAAGDSVTLSLDLRDTRQAELLCADEEMSITSLIKTKVACGLDPADSCDVLLILNSDTIQVAQQKDRFSINALSNFSSIIDADFELVQTRLSLTNIDSRSSRSDTLIWEVYWDANADGLLDTGDELLHSSSPKLYQLPPGAIVQDSLSYAARFSQVCNLLVVIRNTGPSCFCEDPISIALPPPILRNAGPDRTVCSRDMVSIGEDMRTSGISYQWIPPSFGSLTDIENELAGVTSFQRTNMTAVAQVFPLQLVTTRQPGCSTIDTMQVTVWPDLRPNPQVQSDYNGADISCFGASDGSIFADLNLANAPISYTVNGLTQIDNPVFQNLTADDYTIEYIDSNGCRATAAIMLNHPDSLQATLSSTPVVCFGGMDGTISSSITGGTMPYTYNWSIAPQNDAPMAINLTGGVYNLSITDVNGCNFTTDSIIVGEAPQIIYSISTDSTSCWDSSDGQVVLDTLYGGAAPLVVSWPNGQNGLQSENYRGGTFDFSIVDNVGCTVEGSFLIPAPLPVMIDSISQQDVSCFGGNDGLLTIYASGGTGAYDYTWRHNDSTQAVSGLIAGLYQVDISDANDCILNSEFYRITQPDVLSLTFEEVENVRCFGQANGGAIVVPSGGTGPYAFTWTHGPSTAAADNLTAGTYQVLLTDAQDCLHTDSLEITQPDSLLLSLESTSPSCAGNTGFVLFEATGGTPTYSYLLDNGISPSIVPAIEVVPGEYQASVEDANGCQTTERIIVTEPPPFSVELLPGEVTINYGDTVQLEGFVFNARGGIAIDWEPAQWLSCTDCLDPIAVPERSTIYQLEVRDSFNCIDFAQVRFTVQYPRRIFMPTVFSPNGDSNNDLYYPYGGPEVERIELFQIFNRWGNLVHEVKQLDANDPSGGWDGNFQGQPLPSAVYVYRMIVRFTDGLVKEYAGDLTLIR